jgi:TM2 domain-containing membrane protein YozV
MDQTLPPLLTQTPPPVSPPTAGQPTFELQNSLRFENEKKSAGVALLLCWCLGIFGAHRFYANRPNAATMLVITVVSFPLCLVLVRFAGLMATWIWMIADLFSVPN